MQGNVWISRSLSILRSKLPVLRNRLLWTAGCGGWAAGRFVGVIESHKSYVPKVSIYIKTRETTKKETLSSRQHHCIDSDCLGSGLCTFRI